MVKGDIRSGKITYQLLPSSNRKWLACQYINNKIVTFSPLSRFKMNRKKIFTDHVAAAYACSLDVSPDMRYGLGKQQNRVENEKHMLVSVPIYYTSL